MGARRDNVKSQASVKLTFAGAQRGERGEKEVNATAPLLLAPIPPPLMEEQMLPPFD